MDLEENLGYSQTFDNNDLIFRAKQLNISPQSYFYTIEKLGEASFINITYNKTKFQNIIHVESITYSGHQFLENIRNDKNWKKTKAVAKAAGNTSIKIISTVAEKVGAEIALNVLGLK
ncbi:DUF2513 domain-containing protein [Weissella paramesenteroides]|nr:DUF2513 domain-containing protein [Weissella paramesenteroides]